MVSGRTKGKADWLLIFKPGATYPSTSGGFTLDSVFCSPGVVPIIIPYGSLDTERCRGKMGTEFLAAYDPQHGRDATIKIPEIRGSGNRTRRNKKQGGLN